MIKLKVQGMTCGHCVMHVKQAISAVPGVEAPIDVNLEKGEATFGGNPDVDAVLAAVAEEGYAAARMS